MAMMFVLAAVLFTYGVSTGTAMGAGMSRAVAGENDVFPLDMAENSVDDIYSAKCKNKMEKMVTEYLVNEKNKDEHFKEVWDSSEKDVLKKFKKGKTNTLNKDQLVAISYYTSGKNNSYLDFNNKVRTQRPVYKTTFGYHALHFLLTTAIQAINAKQEKESLIVYRRVNSYFSQNVKNKEFRFGSFTSASQGKYGKIIFGEKSCFEIETYMGADVSLYSKFGEGEAEVLIPPYEVFKVLEVEKRLKSELPCEVVYKVKSTKTPVSNLDCALFPKKIT